MDHLWDDWIERVCLAGSFVIARMNASGSFTNAWASTSGLSSTMAMSISPPIFFDESRFAFLHSVQDCHSFVFTDASFPLLNGSLRKRPGLRWEQSGLLGCLVP